MPRFGRPWSCAVAVVTVLAFTATACWRQMPITELEAEKGKGLDNHRLRFVLAGEAGQDDAEVTVQIQKVEFPFAQGLEEGENGAIGKLVTVDLRRVKQVEVYDSAYGTKKVLLNILLGVGITAAVVLAVVLIAVITRTCPMLYVDKGAGMEFAGVPYAGALFRSIQRDDLLPLEGLPQGRVQMKLIDGGLYEKDYTDRAELYVVDHDPALEVLATPDARILLLGKSLPPVRATDLRGRSRLEELRAVDDKVVQTDLTEVERQADPLLRDGVEAEFASAPEKPVLEITAGTTPWIDLVFANYAALFGDRLGNYVDRWNEPGKRAEVLAWRDRQGVDLRVQVLRGGAWQQVASVPTPGPKRTFAVALPGFKAGEPVRVRVSGGIGFWAFDRIAIAPLSGEAQPQRVPAAVALDKQGKDQRRALAANDGDYQVLPETGDELKLAFDLPRLAPGKQRAVFFSSSGYYNVRQGKQGKWSPGKLVSIGDGPDAMARFSLELFRDYQKIALASSKRPVMAEPPER